MAQNQQFKEITDFCENHAKVGLEAKETILRGGKLSVYKTMMCSAAKR